jgi:transcriptional regulator with XRE-family HTH domain
MPFQKDLARESEINQQSRISMLETPGAANITLETLAKIAAGLRVGVVVKFVPFSEMLRWENSFSPDINVTRLENDHEFLNPAAATRLDQPTLGSIAVGAEGLWASGAEAPPRKPPGTIAAPARNIAEFGAASLKPAVVYEIAGQQSSGVYDGR